MTGMMSGMALHGGLIPYGGTFLVFSDYARNAVRLACLMQQRVVLVYSHDSIGLGEDGPTHQPIEQLASLRAMPHLDIWRPCDAAETAVAWTHALEHHGPTALVLTRQPLPQQPRTAQQLANIRARRLRAHRLPRHAGSPRNRHRFRDRHRGAGRELAERRRPARAPRIDALHRDLRRPGRGLPRGVLPRAVTRRLAVEAGATQCWWRYVGTGGGCSASTSSAPRARVPMSSLILVSRRIILRNRSVRCWRIECMAIKVGINGYGRIGRNILRALYEASAPGISRSWRSTTWATRRPMRT